jgi:flagellar hook-basal body complex protein FliE
MAAIFVSANAANAAYQAAQRVAAAASEASAQGVAGANPGATSFSDALHTAIKDAVGTMRVGETQATEGAAGKGDIVQVVNAVTAAELTLETVVAIRDKVIAAYQDIMRMPI